MGTTVAGVVVTPSRVIAFNVGDSRVYRIEDGALVQLSTDDTPGPKLPDGRTAVYTSSIISQVLGGYGSERPERATCPERAAQGRARYLICSDGLTDLLDQAAIEQVLDEDERASAQALFAAAMAQGGDDNISLILVRIEQGGVGPHLLLDRAGHARERRGRSRARRRAIEAYRRTGRPRPARTGPGHPVGKPDTCSAPAGATTSCPHLCASV